jgi:hypothetical protein
MAKKTVQFQQLLPVINEYIAKGYTATEIVVFLKDNYDLSLSVRVFYTYSHLFKNKVKVHKSEPTQNETRSSNPVSENENLTQTESQSKIDRLNSGFLKKQKAQDEIKSYFNEGGIDVSKFTPKE